MTAISSGFGKVVTFGSTENGGESDLQLTSADTVDGSVMNAVKNPLFTNAHTIVKRKGMTNTDVISKWQSNVFYVDDNGTKGINLAGSDGGAVAKMADIINQVITIMENYKDDNDKRAGVQGAKRIVAPNDARLTATLNAALSMDMFDGYGPNPGYKRATLETTPYLNDLSCCFASNKAVGFFIVDPSYNAENQGPEFTERVALTLNIDEKKNPYGISYDARQRFDINVASWRGIAYVYIGSVAPTFNSVTRATASATETKTGFDAMTPLAPLATIVKPVSVVGTVSTKEQS